MKYRALKIHCEPVFDKCFETWIIQVKKWYGWVTFYNIEGETSVVNTKVTSIMNTLKL